MINSSIKSIHSASRQVTAWILLAAFLSQPLALAAEDSETIETDGSATSVGETQLSPGFLLQLSSSQDQKLNGTFRVQKDGKLDLPYSVSVNVSGLTLAQLRSEVAKLYKPYFKDSPNLRIGIKQKRYWVEIRGLVKNPGGYLIKRDSAIDELISLAGGLNDDLSTGFLRIEQGSQVHWIDLTEYFKHGTLKTPPQWQGGERVFFQRERLDGGVNAIIAEAAGKIQVLGEVKNPGEVTFRNEADAYSYLIKTGGPTQAADLDRVELIRLDKNTGKREQVSLGAIADVKSLQEGDILIFHPQRPTGTDRFLATASIVTSIVTAVILTVIAVRGVR